MQGLSMGNVVEYKLTKDVGDPKGESHRCAPRGRRDEGHASRPVRARQDKVRAGAGQGRGEEGGRAK